MTAAHRQAQLTALADICDDAAAARVAAQSKNAEQLAVAVERIRIQADAARTRLVQDGDEYTATAWAVVDTCRIALAEARLRISNWRTGRRA